MVADRRPTSRPSGVRRRSFPAIVGTAAAFLFLAGVVGSIGAGGVRAVDPTPAPSASPWPSGEPVVTPAPVPGVDCVLYPLIGSDLPVCPSPTPHPASSGEPCTWYPIPGSDLPPCERTVPAPTGSPTPAPTADGWSSTWGGVTWCRIEVNENYCWGASPLNVTAGWVYSVEWWASSYMSRTVTGSDWKFVTASGGHTVSTLVSPAAAASGESYPVAKRGSTVPYPFARTGGGPWTVTAAGTGQLWFRPHVDLGGSNPTGWIAALRVTVTNQSQPTPTPSLPVYWRPGIDCTYYPIIGGELPECPEGPQPGVDCTLWPIPGGDMPVCPTPTPSMEPMVPGVTCDETPEVGGLPPCPWNEQNLTPPAFPVMSIWGGYCPTAKFGQLPLRQMPVCDFPGLTLDFGLYFSWLGCVVGALATFLLNLAMSVWNYGVEWIVPCSDTVIAVFGDFGDKIGGGPFTLVPDTVHALQGGLTGGPAVPFGVFTAFGATVQLPLMEVARAAAPIRPFLLPLVAFMVALRALNMLGVTVKGSKGTGSTGGTP